MKKDTFSSKVLSVINRFREKEITFPMKNIENITIRPSEEEGEFLYSIPVVRCIKEDFSVTLLIPEKKEVKYLKKFTKRIKRYPETLSPISVINFKDELKDLNTDLFIDFNRTNVELFKHLLKRPVTSSIYHSRAVDLTADAEGIPYDKKYEHLMGLLGQKIDWSVEGTGLKPWESKDDKVGITSDIGNYPGFIGVKTVGDLYKISYLITKKNDLSSIAFLLGIPQTILLKTEDDFLPPEKVKVVRYRKSLNTETIDKCLPKKKEN